MVLPTYSELLETISSKILDKSTDLTVSINSLVKIFMSQDLYTFVVRMNAMNLTYKDNYLDELNFSQVNEYF